MAAFRDLSAPTGSHRRRVKQARSFRCRHAVRTSHPYGGVGGIQSVRYPGLAATIGAPPAAGERLLEKGSADGITVQAGQGLRPEPPGKEAHREVKDQASKPENRRKLKEFGQRFKKKR